jgi:hypothetical protein
MTTRRAFLFSLACVAPLSARSKEPRIKPPDTPEAFSLWQDFITKWNDCAASLNKGMRDVKLWQRAESALLKLLE